MRTFTPLHRPRLAAATALAIALAVAWPAPAKAAQHSPPECKTLFDLYLTCYETGINADSSLSCLSACADTMTRAGQRLSGAQAAKKLRKESAAHAMAELVCSTGCEDATTALVRATQQEFSEAFCE